jgi:acetylornithine/N-succinyldiaminopimelate aminotransferase
MNNSVAKTYNRKNVSFSHGNGIYLYTADGDKYMDLAAGIAVNILGHSNEKLIEALKVQAEKLWHVSNLYNIEGQQKLAEKLTLSSFADKVFFCNSGAEAVECTIKAARRYHFNKGNNDKSKIITFKGSFHGRTLGTIAAANNSSHLEGFGLPLQGFVNIERNNLDELRSSINDTIAAILIEPIQGEGGINTFDENFINEVNNIAKANDILILFDEVQCGMGRTGKLFAHEWFDVNPDVMALAKGLGGGFPIGACLMTDVVANALGPGTHGSTFGGNPLASAVGNCVMDIVNNNSFLAEVEEKGKIFNSKLNELKAGSNLISEIRGLGLMIGIQFNIDSSIVANKLFEKNLLTVGAGDNVIRLLPPLNISKSEIDEVIDILDITLREIQANG